jgi:peptidyl-prolyl cis-trans isomerase A (cyclophilin A)
MRRFPAALIFALLLCACSESGSDSATATDEMAPERFRVQLETSKGDVVIEVVRAWSPLGADRFYTLVNRQFFDQARFFRVLPGFIAQVGMHAVPDKNEPWASADIQDDPHVESNVRGTVSFASRGPNTRTTQLFINLGDNTATLDPQGFTPVGRVVEGLELADGFYAGYGEGAPMGQGPSQELIRQQGNAYLVDNFPMLDYIRKATVVE